MIAVVQTGGKQYIVRKGDKIRIELIETEEGKTLTFHDVLLVTDGKASSTKIGTPLVTGATVTGKVIVADAKADKKRVYKMKRRTRYRRNKGHRQHFTEVEIADIKA